MANLDTALKRLSGIHPLMPWRASYPIPDGTISRADRQVVPRLYSGVLAAATPTTAAVTGTAAAGIAEADVVAGGKTIIITLAHDTWVSAGATFDAQRQAILNGLDSAQSETHGWNNEVRDAESVTAVVRTSNTVVTITLSTAPAYNIAANETITVTVPSTALTNSAVDVTATPTFGISAALPAATTSSDTIGSKPRKKIRGPYSDPKIFEEYIARCIREREKPNLDIEVAELREELVDQVEARQESDESERSALIAENQLLERLVVLEKTKTVRKAIEARQRQIDLILEVQEQEDEEREIAALLAVFHEM